jgi:hypothetical protein
MVASSIAAFLHEPVTGGEVAVDRIAAQLGYTLVHFELLATTL